METSELKKELRSKIIQYEKLKVHPDYQSEIEQNAVIVLLRELKHLDSIVEFETIN